MATFALNIHLKPLRHGDLDGLCGVHSILNALQWLLPKARDLDYLTKLFDEIIGAIYTIDNIRNGGEEPELEHVFEFVREQAKKKFKLDFALSELSDSAEHFDSPDEAMLAKFGEKGQGAAIFGFEGLDSHWTVARGVTSSEVLLFDSWEYKTFERRKFLWRKETRGVAKTDKIIVDPKELNWVTLG